MDIMSVLSDYYNNYDEDARLTSRHGSVEFLTTVRYIEKYLKDGMKILEIGAGTGRYSHYFARRGFGVDAIELIPHNIDIFNKNTLPGENITVRQGNACSMPFIGSDSYDITLLLGPMYHLYTDETRSEAISEALRVTKKGGIVFSSYCNNDATVICFGFQRGMINNERYAKLIDRNSFTCASVPEEVFSLYRKEDIDRLMSCFNTERLHYVGTDMATNFMRDTVDSMDDLTFGEYLKYHFTICERADMTGATHHMLDIFRKL